MAGRSTEIKHLQALSTIAQELHFGRAANRLGVTQPALSQLIRDLEDRLGFRVLERTTRKVLLTDPGKTFLAEAEFIIRRLDLAIENAREEAGQAANSVRIGAILPTAFGVLPDVLTRFKQRCPTADVHIESGESRNLIRLVETEALQIALLRPPSKTGTLQIETIRKEPFLAVMRQDHRLAEKGEVPLTALKHENLIRIVRSDPEDPFVKIDKALEDAGVDLSVSKSTEGTLTALAHVCAGDGITLVPSWAASLPWSNICFKPVDGLNVSIDLAMVWEKTNLSSVAQQFLDAARRTM